MLSGIKWDTYNYDSYYRFLWQVLCNVNAFGMRIKMLAFCVHFPLWIPTNLSTWNLSLLYRIRLLDGVKSTAHKWNSLSFSDTHTHSPTYTYTEHDTVHAISSKTIFANGKVEENSIHIQANTHAEREKEREQVKTRNVWPSFTSATIFHNIWFPIFSVWIFVYLHFRLHKNVLIINYIWDLHATAMVI